MGCRRKSPEILVVAFSCNSLKANLKVRSMATKVELALLGTDLDIDVEVADRVALELALVGRIALDRGQLRYAVTLQAAVQ